MDTIKCGVCCREVFLGRKGFKPHPAVAHRTISHDGKTVMAFPVCVVHANMHPVVLEPNLVPSNEYESCLSIWDDIGRTAPEDE